MEAAVDGRRVIPSIMSLFSKESWLVAGIVPGVERQPLKKLPADKSGLLKLLERWRAEAEKKGRKITRIAVAFEAGAGPLQDVRDPDLRRGGCQAPPPRAR